MNNQNYSRPIACQPMPPQDYQQLLNGQLQDLSLYDTEELRKTAEWNRAMMRDQQKSQLRQQEFQAKQLAKSVTEEIVVINNNVLLIKYNGLGKKLTEKLLFRCDVELVVRYKREGEREDLWQLVLLENTGKQKTASPLYKSELLQSETKLRQTILAKYDCTTNTENKSHAWRWMRSKLLDMFEQAEVLELPSKAGWYKNLVRWHFWTAADEQSLLINERIRGCQVQHFADLDAEKVIISLLEEIRAFHNTGQAAALLLLRLSALLGRLIESIPTYPGIVVVGDEANTLAKNVLCTMCMNTDVANLDSDRIGKIREQVKDLQDTPMLFLSSDPDNKSTQNRLREVLSWMDSGYVEGIQVTVPFVFCLRGFSKNYPLEGALVFEVDKQMARQKYESFAKLQQLIVSRIEADNGWVERMRKIYNDFSVKNPDEKAVILSRVIISVLLNMFQLGLDESVFVQFEEFLHYGEQEIGRQLCNRGQMLVETFHDKVVKLAEGGKICIMERANAFSLVGPDVIYYDDNLYYFEKKVLRNISCEMNVDNKSLLYIKKQLIELGFVKLYQTDGSRRRELEIDFTVNDFEEGKKQHSGFAIRKEFWDVPGGVALFERGTKIR